MEVPLLRVDLMAWYCPWEYDQADWLPCPDCFDVHDYTMELTRVLDSMGGTDFGLDLDYDFSDPYFSNGSTVECERDGEGEIVARTFRGCATCGGGGECYKGPGDDYVGKGKSWHQWVVVEGGVTLGSGKVPKQGERHKALMDAVDEQAKDEGLWFIAETASEAYLQQELRRLHALVEWAVGDADG